MFPAEPAQPVAHRAAVTALEERIRELDPTGRVLDARHQKGDGRLEPCSHKAFRRYDIISSIGAGSWRGAIPMREPTASGGRSSRTGSSPRSRPGSKAESSRRERRRPATGRSSTSWANRTRRRFSSPYSWFPSCGPGRSPHPGAPRAVEFDCKPLYHFPHPFGWLLLQRTKRGPGAYGLTRSPVRL